MSVPNAFLRMPPRDRDAIFLAATFFWLQHHATTLPEGSKGNPRNIADAFTKHPLRAWFFGNLSDQEIECICVQLGNAFEAQELALSCGDRSYYDAPTAEIFAISAAADTLAVCGNRHKNPIVYWFDGIGEKIVQRWTVEMVCRQKGEEFELGNNLESLAKLFLSPENTPAQAPT